jgi:hypothetical protein
VKATARCRRCGAPIGFARTANGKMMPLDPEPVEDGNVFVVEAPGSVTAIVASKANPTPPGEPHLSHFATCPAAESFRRK